MEEENKKPSTLFLDVGGVLLTNGWDREGRLAAAEKFNLDYAELNERHHLTYDTYESGKLSLQEYLDRIVFFEKRSFTHEQFRKFMLSRSKAFPDMIDLVRALKAKHKLRIGVISNEGRELNEYRITNFGLSEFVDFFVSSSFVHIRKPDRDIYKVAVDMALTVPGDSVYIDDRAMFTQVAAGLGFKTITHKDYRTTKASLELFGLGL